MNTDSPRILALEALKRLHHPDDIEIAHIAADDVLCDLLSALGYRDVVDAYHKVPKWYS